jgi:hypothetical protein
MVLCTECFKRIPALQKEGSFCQWCGTVLVCSAKCHQKHLERNVCDEIKLCKDRTYESLSNDYYADGVNIKILDYVHKYVAENFKICMLCNMAGKLNRIRGCVVCDDCYEMHVKYGGQSVEKINICLNVYDAKILTKEPVDLAKDIDLVNDLFSNSTPQVPVKYKNELDDDLELIKALELSRLEAKSSADDEDEKKQGPLPPPRSIGLPNGGSNVPFM